MKAKLSAIWNKTLKILKEREDVSLITYENWLESLSPVGISDNIVYLRVPSEVHYEVVKTMHADKIREALNEVDEASYEVVVLNVNEETPASLEFSVSFEGREDDATTLNPRYTFDSFVVGDSNQLAHAASKAVSERPAHAFNPLFIYGGAGLGKTHLAQAIGNKIKESNKDANILYITSEKFTNDFINTIIEKKNTIDFRNKYRACDVLIVDDIQFISNKDQTQNEFFHTFNALHESNKQIILTSDRPPKEMRELEERLRTRFEWGLIADIKPPNLETRIAILKKKAEEENFEVPENIIYYIAEKLKSNIRNLEGALKRLTAYNVLMGEEITMELADKSIQEFLNKNEETINTEYILSIVANYFNITPDEILSSKRTQEISYARHITMYLMRECTELSLPKIGQELGGRKHPAIHHGINNIKESMKHDEGTRKIIEELKKNLANKE